MNPTAELNRILAICYGQPKDLELIELYREVEEQMSDEMKVSEQHKWVRVAENFYECSKCGCEVEGYGECIFACEPQRRLEEK
jgi:hypothetical protein